MQTFRFIAVTSIATAFMLVGLPAAAFTAPVADERSGTEVCSLNIETGDYACYDDTAAYVEARGGNRRAAKSVSFSDGLSVEELNSLQLSTTLNAAMYDGENLTGSVLYMEASYGCDDDPDWDWRWDNLTASWVDRISSFRGYNRCQVKLWDFGGYVGANIGGPNSTTIYILGAMNNEAQSVKMF